MHIYVEQCVREAGGDWLNAGARPGLVDEVPARVFPSIDVYDSITCPMTIVLADAGFHASRRDEVRTVVDAAADRELVDVTSNHNIPMTRMTSPGSSSTCCEPVSVVTHDGKDCCAAR